MVERSDGLSRRELIGIGVGLAIMEPFPFRTSSVLTYDAQLSLPDPLIVAAYQSAANKNVLAAVNPKVFPGYYCVCADGQGFGYGNSYPSLDGHQLTDALLWLGQVDTVRANWDYIKSFQHPDGRLPLAILPRMAGKDIGPAGYPGFVEANGGLYKHWVPGDPLAALSSPTYIQNADVIFRRTLDRTWLASQIASINLSAEYLASLINPHGAVRGGGYYVERPTRLDCDGVTQPHAIDAFRMVAAMNRLLGITSAANRYEEIAGRIHHNLVTRFWMEDHFAEYSNPEHGLIDRHGLCDSDWAAMAFGTITKEQEAILWPRLKDEERFHYGGMPTGICTEPERYEDWEFAYPDKMDLAAMGRVWYVECQARARMGDGEGLVDTLRRVAKMGQDNGFYWRERYTAKGGHGAEKYCEYPANLIRVVQRFLLGVNMGYDGSLTLAPTVPPAYWEKGFGQKLSWQDRALEYRMDLEMVSGSYFGGPQQLIVRLESLRSKRPIQMMLNGKIHSVRTDSGVVHVHLPATVADMPCRFEIRTPQSS
jgi:hypothetical protein